MMIGPLKGAMMSTTPLGSIRILGLMAQKLRLKSPLRVADHFSQLSYAVLMSMYVPGRSMLAFSQTAHE